MADGIKPVILPSKSILCARPEAGGVLDSSAKVTIVAMEEELLSRTPYL